MMVVLGKTEVVFTFSDTTAASHAYWNGHKPDICNTNWPLY